MSRSIIWWSGIVGCCAITWWGVFVAPLPRPNGFLIIPWAFGMMTLPYLVSWSVLAAPTLAAGLGSALWLSSVLAGVSLAIFALAFVAGLTLILSGFTLVAVPVAAALFGNIVSREHERIQMGGDADAWRRIHRRGFLIAGWGVPGIWVLSTVLLVATAPHPAPPPSAWDRFSSLGPGWILVALSLAGAVPGFGWHAWASLRQLCREHRASPSRWQAALVILGPYVLVAAASASQGELRDALAWPVSAVERNLTRPVPAGVSGTRD
ncbi:hypothetical protein GWK16_06700 [Roseomonas sp. JC162]|uniref:Uncharacterized protein n=1 Tax=Neoroseomonas marina TaxID=1232220 RepID=A0A848E8Z4_9PROT|nr:hypothetical protein [Neoroseomonas marina]NMJ40921.1 hypothetical protein [Neoroseomonas marina]